MLQGQPFALQLQWESCSAFTSWSGEVIHSKKHDLSTGSSSVVLLGKKFADSLGLDKDQQVILNKETFQSARKITFLFIFVFNLWGSCAPRLCSSCLLCPNHIKVL